MSDFFAVLIRKSDSDLHKNDLTAKRKGDSSGLDSTLRSF